MRLQVDNEFQLVKIKDLNDENNVVMFTSSTRDGKAFAAEQTITELKTRTLKLNAQKLKITPTKVILNSDQNMNNVKSEKYGFSPKEIEMKLISSERFRTMFNMHRIEIKLLQDRLDRYDNKIYSAKKKKAKGHLMISENVLALAERTRKKSSPGKFYLKGINFREFCEFLPKL